jgi:hypothetical protein
VSPHFPALASFPAATPPFTTPYGKQDYYLNYTNPGITTAEGIIAPSPQTSPAQ